MKHGKYLTIKKEGKGIKYYYVDTERHWIQIEFVPRVYFGMSYTPEWHEYMKKTSIKISPFNIHYFKGYRTNNGKIQKHEIFKPAT